MRFYTNVEKVGNNILCRGYENGKIFFEKEQFSPSLFIETNKQSKFKNIYGKTLEEIKFNTIYDAHNFIDKYKDVDNFKYYGMEKWVTQYISKNYWSEIKYDYNLINVVWIDIETGVTGGFAKPDDPFQPITAVTLIFNDEKVVFGYGDFKAPKGIKYYKQKDESALLDSVIEIISKKKPDIISGWNSESFDVPYFINRSVKILGEDRTKDLSPYRIIKRKTIPTMNGEEATGYDILGISHLDYMLVYKKLSDKVQESYKLNHIGQEEIGVSKIDYSEYKSLDDLMNNDYQKYMEYNIRDTEILPKLEEKLKLLQLIYMIAYYSKTNFIDVFKNTRIWDSIIYNHLIEKNIIVDANFETDDTEIEGGYVKVAPLTYCRWVVTFDATSLYPSIIMSLNVSPETFVKKIDYDYRDFLKTKTNPHTNYLKSINAGMGGNGSVFSNEKRGFLSIITEDMFNLRAEYKKRMLECAKEAQLKKDTPEYEKLMSEKDYNDLRQIAFKKIANSVYGALAADGFRYQHANFGEAITKTGQLILQLGELNLNETLNKFLKTDNVDYVIYMDTDSLMVNMEAVAEKSGITDEKTIVDFLQKFYKEKMTILFKRYYDNMANAFNTYDQKIHFKIEKICKAALFSGVKKRYIMTVWDKEGTRYDKPQLNVTGFESVRSTTPMPVRIALKNIYDIFMNKTNDDVLDCIDSFREKYMRMSPEEISVPTGVKGLAKYSDRKTVYKKGCPMHVRAALLYNKIIADKNLTEKYEQIQEGEKIKYVYLKTPNPTHENVIGFTQVLPKELGLHEYVDMKTTFEKNFLKPLENIFKARDWKANRDSDLSDFFS